MLDKLQVTLTTLVLLYITVSSATEVFLDATTDDITEPSQSLTLSGGDVTLRLRIKNFAVGSFVKWTRVNEKDTVELGQNHIIEDDISDLKDRYVFSENPEQIDDFKGTTDFKIDLTIKDFRLEDAGTYKVQPGGGGSTDEITLTFRKPATSVKFTYNGKEITSDEEYDIVPGSNHSLQCEVSGVAPKPKLAIKGDEDDVSSGNNAYTTEETTDDNTFGDSGLFYAITYGATLKGKEVLFDAMYANKDIYCEVDVGGEVLKSAAFKAKFPGQPPVWDKNCPMESLQNLGAVNQNFSCTVTSEPKADIRFVWHYHNPAATDSIEITGDTERTDLPPFYRAATEELGEDTQKATLFIDSIKQQMFRNYSFIAKNKLGEATYTLNVSHDPSYEIVTDSASQLLATSSFIITAIYFLLH